jgi:cysteine desulfurase
MNVVELGSVCTEPRYQPESAKCSPMNREIFLDNNATTRPLPAVLEIVRVAMSDLFGNPSSSNQAGERSRRLVRDGREALSRLLGAPADTIHFTSGATEANNWVLLRTCAKAGSSLVTTVAEHSSIKVLCDFLESQGTIVHRLPVDRLGRLDPLRVLDAITSATTIVSVQWVNNETGTIQPVEEIARICSERKVLFHTDASQAIGKLPVNVEQLGCDFLSFSAHKFHGPQGIGGLYVRSGRKLTPFLLGGPQEYGRRAGTENVPGICGAGVAALTRHSELSDTIARLRYLRDRFEFSVLAQISGVLINGDTQNRVCNTTNLRFGGIDGEALVARLDQHGIRCSQSAACTNQRPEPSYVLRAMGLSEPEAYSSLRFSFSVFNSEQQIDETVQCLAKLVAQLRRFAESTNEQSC